MLGWLIRVERKHVAAGTGEFMRISVQPVRTENEYALGFEAGTKRLGSACFTLGLALHLEDGGNKFLRNVG
jgi:hypothetical protein